jgi:DnaJ family protein C protein 11
MNLVLMDPNKRYIYDQFGEQALEECWTVGTYMNTPEEIRSEIERRKYEAEQRKLDAGMKAEVKLLTCSDQGESSDANQYTAHVRNVSSFIW